MTAMQTPLRKIRHHRGLKLEEVVKAVGSDTGNLSRIERGEQTPSRGFAARLAKFYDSEISVAQIICPEEFSDWMPH